MASINYVELKVADLREECRKRSLDSTGLKVHLVERLKKFDRDEIRLQEEKVKAAEIIEAKETLESSETKQDDNKDSSNISKPENKETKTENQKVDTKKDDKKYDTKSKSTFDKKKDIYELASYEPENWWTRPEIILDYYNSDLNVCIDESGVFAQPLHKDGFQYMYGGVKATYGITSGKVYYEIKISRRHYVDWMSEASQMNQLRVGWSTDKCSLSLGDELMSFAYDSNGKKMTEGTIAEYGEGFSEGDIIGCFLEFVGDSFTIRYSVNGKSQGDAFVIPSRNLLSNMLIPHIYTRNMSFEVNFGGKEPWLVPKTKTSESDETEIDDMTWIQIGKLNANQLIKSIKAPEKFQECEVLMMCGLPGSGKTYWAEKHLIENPEKHYNILSVNKIMEKMKIPNRKSMSSKTRDNILQAATDCLNKLLEIVVSRKRNYILDQTNVYPNAQRRRMCPFDKFLRKAIIVIPTDEEFQNRIKQAVEKEDKDIPEKAMLQMKENFVIPDDKNEYFDEIIFVELQRPDAVELIKKYSDEAKSLNKNSTSSSNSKDNNSKDHRNDKKSDKEDDFGLWNAKSDDVADDKWSRSMADDKGKSSSRSSRDRKDSSHRRSSNRDDDKKDSRSSKSSSRNKRDDRRSSSSHRKDDKDDVRRPRYNRSRSPGDRRRNDRRPESSSSKSYSSNSGQANRYDRIGGMNQNHDDNRTMGRQNMSGGGRGYGGPPAQMAPLGGSRFDSDYQSLRREVGNIEESLDSLIRRYDDRPYDSRRPRDDVSASRGRGMSNSNVPMSDNLRNQYDESFGRGGSKDEYGSYDSGYGKPLRGREGFGMARNRNDYTQPKVRDDYTLPKSREDYLLPNIRGGYSNNYGGSGGYDNQEISYRPPYNQDEQPSSTQSSKFGMSKERKSRFGDRKEQEDTQPLSSSYHNYSDMGTNSSAEEARILPEKYRGPGLTNKRQSHAEPDSSSSNIHMQPKIPKHSQYSEQYGSVNSTQDYGSFISGNNQSQSYRGGYGHGSTRGARGSSNGNQQSHPNSASFSDYSYSTKSGNFGQPMKTPYPESHQPDELDSNYQNFSNYEDEPSSTTSSQYKSYDDFVKKIKKPMTTPPNKQSVSSTSSLSQAAPYSNPYSAFYSTNSNSSGPKSAAGVTSSYGAANQTSRKSQMDDKSQPASQGAPTYSKPASDYYGQNATATNTSTNNYYNYNRGGYSNANSRGGYGTNPGNVNPNSTKPPPFSGSVMNTNFGNVANTEGTKPSSSTDNAKYNANSAYPNQSGSTGYNSSYTNPQSYISNIKPNTTAGYGKSGGNTGYNNPTGNAGYNNPTGNTGYNNPTGNSGYNNPTGNSGYNNPTGSSAYSKPNPGSYSVPIANASYSKPSGNAGYSNPMPNTGYNKPSGNTAYNNPSGSVSYTSQDAVTGYNNPNANSAYSKIGGMTEYSNPNLNTGYSIPSANTGYNSTGATAYSNPSVSAAYKQPTTNAGYTMTSGTAGYTNPSSSSAYTKPTGNSGYVNPSMGYTSGNAGYNKPTGNMGYFNPTSSTGYNNPVGDKSNAYASFTNTNIPPPMQPNQKSQITTPTTNKPGLAPPPPPSVNYQGSATGYSYPQNYPF